MCLPLMCEVTRYRWVIFNRILKKKKKKNIFATPQKYTSSQGGLGRHFIVLKGDACAMGLFHTGLLFSIYRKLWFVISHLVVEMSSVEDLRIVRVLQAFSWTSKGQLSPFPNLHSIFVFRSFWTYLRTVKFNSREYIAHRDATKLCVNGLGSFVILR